ncbi:MAG: hypothetical protein GY906_38690 [bacterium]|nr:hypothetical protein [bacterium]
MYLIPMSNGAMVDPNDQQLGGIFGTIGRIAGGVVKGATGIDVGGIFGGGNGGPGGRSPEVIAADAADQSRYFEMAKAGDTTTVVESGMTAEQRLQWEASPANAGNPAEVGGAQRYLTMLEQYRTAQLEQRGAGGGAFAPVMAGIGGGINPLLLAGVAGLGMMLLLGRRK